MTKKHSNNIKLYPSKPSSRILPHDECHSSRRKVPDFGGVNIQTIPTIAEEVAVVAVGLDDRGISVEQGEAIAVFTAGKDLYGMSAVFVLRLVLGGVCIRTPSWVAVPTSKDCAAVKEGSPKTVTALTVDAVSLAYRIGGGNVVDCVLCWA